MTSGKSITLTRYEANLKGIWDSFVDSSRNGTFLLKRDYMDYHADRFADHSLLFYADNRLVAVLPAHTQGALFCSHNGLTYGGLLLHRQTTAQLTIELMEALTVYLQELGTFETLLYRPIPHIYHNYPTEEDLYALYRCNARLSARKIASVVQQSDAIPFSSLRRRKLKLAQNLDYLVHTNDNWPEFWKILEETLMVHHNTTPVHTLEEMLLLHQRFPDNIRLYTVTTKDGVVLGGTVVYTTPLVAHIQYIASSNEGRNKGGLDFLFDYLIHVRYRNKAFFDLGTSVEDGGRYLNEGLIFQKEGFGGRAIVYDTYEINLKHPK